MKSISVTESLLTYLHSVSLREPGILPALRQETLQMPEGGMQIAPEQGQFMAFLARLIHAQKILEVGVFTGYSSLCFALALPEKGRLVACDISETYSAIARRYWQLADVDSKIDLRIAPALQTLDALLASGEAETFDLAFIDADKSNYDAYYEKSLQLLRLGGLMLIDNVLWSGAVADPAITDADTVALRNLNQKLHQDQRIELAMLPIADGLTLAMKR
ncbi:MAG: SAM-dependent methyltransferase [Synechococcaceae cyanobacterium SM2_3_2]|nr:SAM-dependent methyltransferase [Synechococcaceae cyanobacterium SM2_3_2]